MAFERARVLGLVLLLLFAGCGNAARDGSDLGAGGAADLSVPDLSDAAAACSFAAADCPASGTACIVPVCDSGRCATANAVIGTPCADSGGSVCLGNGHCVACLQASSCPSQSTTCKLNVCDGTAHTCSTTNAAKGTACSDGGGIVCDGNGACVAMHCMDGVLDADETAVDCGGSCGATCNTNDACKVAGDCASGICSGTPRVCQPSCAATCSGFCKSCTVPGQTGTCASFPQGVADTVNHCESAAVCDVGAVCTATGGKAHFGDPCGQDTDCFNGTCAAGYCKLKSGDACAEDAACKSGRCFANVCAACGVDGDCASGRCNAGLCLLLGGFQCAASGDCASGLCTAKKTCVQGGSEPCTTAGCLTHFCTGGNCATCSSSADCPLGTACTGGSCLAPPGAYCNASGDCASGVCASTAFLSMRKCQ